jgi:hypothetical protein
MARRCIIAWLTLALASTAAMAQVVTIGENFTGSTFGIDSNFPMPDTMGASGIDHFVELINGRYSVYRKSDGVKVETRTLNNFWTLAGAAPTGNAFDPRVLYDPHARRYYAVAVDNGTLANNFLFGISNTSDPTQGWTAFKIDSDSDDSNWADFPMLGFNPEAVYVSANMAPLTAGQTRMGFIQFIKGDLLQPTPSIANMTLLEDVPRPLGTNALSPQLAIDASNLFALNTTLPVLMHDFSATTMYRAEIVSGSVTNVGPVGVPAVPNPPTVDQPGPKQNLEANDGRSTANTVLINGEIYAVHAVDDGGLAAVRFLRIDAATNTVLENQTISDPGSQATTFPSVAVNEFGDVVIGVTRTGTGPGEFASSYAIVGKTVGGITTFNPPMLLKQGVSDYERLVGTRNRWGDYSSTTVDPADPGIFWTSQEFVSSTDVWSTQVTEVMVLQPNEARWTDAAGGTFTDPAKWQTAHGTTPLPAEHLIVSRATDLSGVSTTIVFPPQPPPYSYQSLSVRQGDVFLDLAGNQLDLALHVEVGPYNSQPRLTIANGTVNSVAGFIAPQSTSEGQLVLNNTHWMVDTVIVGSAPHASACCGLPGVFGGSGTLAIENNSQLDISGTLTIWGHAAVNLVDGVLSADHIRQNAPPLPSGGGFGLNFTGGTLAVNRFDGILINSGGTLAPGGYGAVGTTDVNLVYDQLGGAGGKLAIDIAGPNPGDYDELIVGGDARLGQLDISFLGGYLPALSDTFEIVNAGTIPLTGVASLVASTVFPSTGTNFLGWHVFHGLNLSGGFALTLAIVPTLTGDFNADGTVNAADYVVWRNMSGQTGIGLAADSNFDGVVNFIDHLAWRSNFGASIPGPGAGSGDVPEPATILMLTAWAYILALGNTRRSLENRSAR